MLKFARTVKKTLHFTTLLGEWRSQAAALLRAEGGGGGRELQQQQWPNRFLPLPSKAPAQRGDSCLPPPLPR